MFVPVSSSETLLSRLSESALQEPPLTGTQQMLQESVSHFLDESTRWQTLGAVFSGTLAHRFVRLGALSLAGGISPVSLQIVSHGAALFAEASSFEISHRLFNRLSGQEVSFDWRGSKGLGRSIYANALNFGVLRFLQIPALRQNLLLQNLTGDMAMVLGEEISSALQLQMAPDGNFFQRMLHAQIIQCQLHAGQSLSARLLPGMVSLERGLDFSYHQSTYSLRKDLSKFFDTQLPVLEATHQMQMAIYDTKDNGGRLEGENVFSNSSHGPFHKTQNRFIDEKSAGGSTASLDTIEDKHGLLGRITHFLSSHGTSFRNPRINYVGNDCSPEMIGEIVQLMETSPLSLGQEILVQIKSGETQWRFYGETGTVKVDIQEAGFTETREVHSFSPQPIEYLYAELYRNVKRFGSLQPGEFIPREEVLALAKTRGGHMLPEDSTLLGRFFSQMGEVTEKLDQKTLRESFRILGESLENPQTVANTFLASIRNSMIYEAEISWLAEELPGVTTAQILSLDPSVDGSLPHIVASIESARESAKVTGLYFSSIFRKADPEILRRVWDPNRPLGMVAPYIRFYGQILPFLPRDIKEEIGAENFKPYQEIHQDLGLPIQAP